MQFVPKKFKRLHDLLILLRDQTSAHVDAHSFTFKGLPANNVQLTVRNGQAVFGTHSVKFKLELISAIRDLAIALEKRMQEHSNKLVSEYMML